MLTNDPSSRAYVKAPGHVLDGVRVSVVKRNRKTVTVETCDGHPYRVPWGMLVSEGVWLERHGHPACSRCGDRGCSFCREAGL